VNNPYAGCIIPKPYYMNNNNVKGIMIELNKRLYMNENTVKDEKVVQLNTVMKGYFSEL
jgi:N-formylglutamate amidohydrolase